LPKWTRIGSIEPSHTQKGTAYLAARRYMWDDFKPYVFKTTDYGKHWTRIANGLPENQYVFTVRQDSKEPDLLFATTKNTVYVSLNGGKKWLPFGLNLPHAQVRDIAIQPEQNQAVVATHGRGFWVLDDLALLRQLAKHPHVGSGSPHLFAPQQTWLTKSYGAQNRYAPDTAGQNPPFGATVFFHLPENYNGHSPAKLTFTDVKGNTVRSYTLHLKKKKSKQEKQQSENVRSARAKEPGEKQHRKKAKKKNTIAVTPGINRFQWDLRSPSAVQVKAFHPPEAAGGLESALKGPEVVPGKYYAVLTYRGHTMRQPFKVKLDPRLSASQQDLVARRQFLMKIHETLNDLDSTLNKAIPLRQQLRKAVKNGDLSSSRARGVLAALNQNIGATVQLNIHSSEGDLLHETKLHSELGALASSAEQAYVRPDKAQHEVF
jgi:hypothetical protein